MTGGPYGAGYGGIFTEVYNNLDMSGVSSEAAMIGAAHATDAAIAFALSGGGIEMSWMNPGPPGGLTAEDHGGDGGRGTIYGFYAGGMPWNPPRPIFSAAYALAHPGCPGVTIVNGVALPMGSYSYGAISGDPSIGGNPIVTPTGGVVGTNFRKGR